MLKLITQAVGFILGTVVALILLTALVKADEVPGVSPRVTEAVMNVVFTMAGCERTMINNGYATFRLSVSGTIPTRTLDGWYSAARDEFERIPLHVRLATYSPAACIALTNKYLNEAALAASQR